MRCIDCGETTSVEETREHELSTIRRRRKCVNGHVNTTIEIPLEAFRLASGSMRKRLESLSTTAAKAMRDDCIAVDQRPVAEIAQSHGVKKSLVYLIKARAKKS